MFEDEDYSDTDVRDSLDGSMESSKREVCDMCDAVVERNVQLSIELNSLKARLAQVEKELEMERKERREEQQQKETEWVTVRKKKSASAVNGKRRSVVTELANRFEALAQDSNSMVAKESGEQDVVLVRKNDSRRNRPKKRRVLLLASSQGRHCSRILGERLGKDYEVCGVVKPNGKFKDVVESVEKLVVDFGREDSVIVMAGGNDEEDAEYKDSLCNAIGRLMSIRSKARVIVNTLPPRYDKEFLNSKVRSMNRFIGAEVNRCKFYGGTKNVFINSDMENMERKYFTRHGLHLNYQGKKFFCDQMVNLMAVIASNLQ